MLLDLSHWPHLNHWKDLWIFKGFNVEREPGSPMISINGVQGYLIEGDVQYLWNLGQQLPVNGSYLEIGSWMGLSSIIIANSLLAKLNLGSRIYCVDTWRGSEEHQDLAVIKENQLFDVFRQNVQASGLASLIHPQRGPSIEIAKFFDDQSLDIVFIDGDHSFEGCYADICAWYPKTKAEGKVVGHDAVENGGVYQALVKFCTERRLAFRIIPPPEAHYVFEIFPGR